LMTAPLIYTLSLHDALPIFATFVQLNPGSFECFCLSHFKQCFNDPRKVRVHGFTRCVRVTFLDGIKNFLMLIQTICSSDLAYTIDRKSTRLNSSHVKITYAV